MELTQLTAFSPIVPLIYAIFIRESIFPFLVGFILGYLISVILNRLSQFLEEESYLHFKDGFIITSMSFIILPILASIPYLWHFSFLNSYFEAVSGMTTTGLSIISNPALMPKSLILWRSFTQWIGGMGIIMLFLYIIYKLRNEENYDVGHSINLFKSLITDIMDTRATLLFHRIFFIYSAYTFLGIVSLVIAGLDVFDAVNIALTSLATGGFVPRNNFSFSGPIYLITILLMIIGSISFVVHNRIFRLRIIKALKNKELKTFAVVILFSFLVLFSTGILTKATIFNTISALTGTGFAMGNVSAYAPGAIFLLIILMLIGGSTASTSGGIKLYRLYAHFKILLWHIKKLSLPSRAVVPLKFSKEEEVIKEEQVISLTMIVTLFILILVFGSFILMVSNNLSIKNALFQESSALFTVGLSTIKINSLDAIGKLTLSISMLLGRIEVIPFLVFLRSIFFRS
jgi:trk system potassium uptake protein TrkH